MAAEKAARDSSARRRRPRWCAARPWAGRGQRRPGRDVGGRVSRAREPPCGERNRSIVPPTGRSDHAGSTPLRPVPQAWAGLSRRSVGRSPASSGNRVAKRTKVSEGFRRLRQQAAAGLRGRRRRVAVRLGWRSRCASHRLPRERGPRARGPRTRSAWSRAGRPRDERSRRSIRCRRSCARLRPSGAARAAISAAMPSASAALSG